jgi:DNA modification methylase
MPPMKNPYVRFHKIDKPPVSEHSTTLWDYPSQHYGKREQGSSGYRGATPSHVIWNVITKWCPPAGLVVDPFCGSGTTLDVCKDLSRQGRGFDLAPAHPQVEPGDARTLPVAAGSVDVVFFDPPYADNLAYSDDARCIGKLSAGDGAWGRAMDQVVREAQRVLKPGGVLAMFVCDQLRSRAGQTSFAPLGLQLATLAEDAGFDMIDHVAVVRRGRTLEDGAGKLQAQRERFMLRGFSHLLVFAKAGRAGAQNAAQPKHPPAKHATAKPAPRDRSRPRRRR